MKKQFKKALSMVLSAAMVVTLGSGLELKSAGAADTGAKYTASLFGIDASNATVAGAEFTATAEQKTVEISATIPKDNMPYFNEHWENFYVSITAPSATDLDVEFAGMTVNGTAVATGAGSGYTFAEPAVNTKSDGTTEININNKYGGNTAYFDSAKMLAGLGEGLILL